MGNSSHHAKLRGNWSDLAELRWFSDFFKMANVRHLGLVVCMFGPQGRTFGGLCCCATFGWNWWSSSDNRTAYEGSAFSALTLLVGRQEEHLAHKKWVMRYRHGYLSGARCKWSVYCPADATVTPSLAVEPIGQGNFPPTFVGKHCCVPYHFSASELIITPFHVELIHIISFMHASENRFRIAYFHKKCRQLPGSFAPDLHRGLSHRPHWGTGPIAPFLPSDFKLPSATCAPCCH